MSYYNNQLNHFNVNSNYEAQSQRGAQSSRSNIPELPNQIADISYSTLEPTAEEFRPLSETRSANGAVKKTFRNEKNQYKNRDKNKRNWYGSGRTYNGSKRDNFNRNDRSYRSEDHQDPSTSFSGRSNQEPSRNDRMYNKGELGASQDADQGLEKSSNERFSEDLKSRSYKSDMFSKDKRNSDYTQHYQYERNVDSSNKQYGNRSKFRDNTRTEFQMFNPESSKSYETSNKNFKGNSRTYDKSYKSNNYNRYDRSNHYDKPESNNTNYDKYNRNDKYDNFGRNFSNYYKKTSNSSTERTNSNTSQFENESSNGSRAELSNDFKNTFNAKLYVSKNDKYAEDKNRKDWRLPSSSNKHSKDSITKLDQKLDAASQRERLEEMLNRRLLECLVCCDKIRHPDKVWSCSQCYHILHLHCVAAWAKSSKIENGWRCPACQNVCNEVPKQYKCYCGKTVDPKYTPGVVPHGCGDVCLRKGRTCDHKCTILCHPGPCPECDLMVAKSCGCGFTKPIVKCSTDIEIVCQSICNKTLNCGIHQCKSVCHPGDCVKCTETIIQECYCGKQGRKVVCSTEYCGSTNYICEDLCGKLLSCGNHKCKRICHEGPCDPCVRDVNLVKTCPCGRTKLEKQRKSCVEAIPCCDKICGKVLKCGQPSLPHTCREKCHEGDCPKCPLTTIVRCRCGHMDKELPCQKLTTKADDARCEKKCTKKRTCGKHKCNQRCCIEIEHFCPLPCNHQLSCGQHRCERTCHSGRCPTCMETSFEELYCECGASVLYPPVPCGTKPPTCSNPCSRQRPCGHEVNHNCHTGACPPCTILSKRWCYGHHEQRSAIPCHQQHFSCGLPCGKPMPCGRHRCNKPCHEGGCPLPCKQPCSIQRTLCGHPCGRTCHDPPCPESNCKQKVPVTCSCGLQKSTRPCLEVSEEFKDLEMAKLREKMGELSKDQTVDISDLYKPKKPTVLKILECTEECRVLERNRRLAIGLQIRNPDLSQKLTPRYTDFMKQWAKKDAHFCQKIHDKLTELVQLAKQSKQKSRSYSFESMNRDKRHFVHEYCEHFGIESAAYDTEPNRNIVATAIKDKSWLPSMSLLEVIQRENGQRKVPGPSVLGRNTSTKSEAVSLRLPSQTQRPSMHSNEFVDYFDSPP